MDNNRPTQEYHVTWEIDMEASTPVEAAKAAWDAMRAIDSMANVFTVNGPDALQIRVDLTEEGEKSDA